MRKIIAITCLAVICLLALASFNSDPDVPDPNFLSSDLYFQIGDLEISIPVVAMNSISSNSLKPTALPSYSTHSPFGGNDRRFATKEYKDALLGLAGDNTALLKLDSIGLNFEVYGSYGEYSVSSKICPLLTEKWSQDICRSSQARSEYGLPRRLRLVTEDGLDIFSRYSFSGIKGERGSDLIDIIRSFSKTAKVGCTRENEYCYAGIAVSENVFSVWNVYCQELTIETCAIQSKTEGHSIYKLVQEHLVFKQ